MRRSIASLAVALLLLPGPARAQGPAGGRDPARQAICKAVAGDRAPAADLPTPAQARTLVGCDPAALYAGADGRPDYVRARLCALTPGGARGDPSLAHIDGDEVLIEIYANGLGVRRNLDLAIAYACKDGNAAPAAVEGRVQHLASLRDHPEGKRFDYCDDITSGYMEGACAALHARVADGARGLRSKRLAAALPPAAKAAYAQARRAADAYAESLARNEVDLSGTGRAAFEIQAEETVRDAFARHVASLVRGAWPRTSPARSRAATAALRTAYARALSALAPGTDLARFTTLRRRGVQATQRLWLAYRDAFVRLAGEARDPVDSASVVALLARERAAHLGRLAAS